MTNTSNNPSAQPYRPLDMEITLHDSVIDRVETIPMVEKSLLLDLQRQLEDANRIIADREQSLERVYSERLEIRELCKAEDSGGTVSSVKEMLEKLTASEKQVEELKQQLENSKAAAALFKLSAEGFKREISYLRSYGNKDCTTMADEALQADGEE